MEMDKRSLAKQKRSKPDKRDTHRTKPVISRGGEGELGTMIVTPDNLELYKVQLERSARLPHGRLEQRIG